MNVHDTLDVPEASLPRPLPEAEIALIRFGYVLKARIDALDLSFAQVSGLTGLSTRQIAAACNGKPVSAGATHVLAVLAGIHLDEMMPAATQEVLAKVRRLRGLA